MATKNIVPRATGEGNLGTSLKHWLKGWFDSVFTANGITDGTDTVTVAEMRAAVDTARWKTIQSSKYTATPANSSTITMSDTSDMKVGLPIEYTDSRGTFYAVIKTVTANTSIVIDGAPLDTLADLTALAVGQPEMVVTVILDVPGTYADAADTDLNDGVDGKKHIWLSASAYCVHVRMLHSLADTGASQPRGNVRLGTEVVGVCSANTSNGLTLGAAQTFVQTGVDINAANYQVNRGDKLTLTTDAAGTNNDAAGLEAHLVFILA